MKRAILLALLLGGCQTAQEKLAADDAQCRSYGTKVGDPAYIQCRSNLDNNRAAIRASEQFGNAGGLVGFIERHTEN